MNPNEVVAYGVAMKGCILSGKETKDIFLLDVAPRILGIQTIDVMMSKLILRNTVIPTERSRVFTTLQDD